ncbi:MULTISPECIES: hypothetical protein [unclassified Neobacillus]|nr:hypothetical protein [Neobacillus sp. MER 74]
MYEQLKSLRNEFNAQTYDIYNDQEIGVLSDLLGRFVEHLKEEE